MTKRNKRWKYFLKDLNGNPIGRVHRNKKRNLIQYLCTNGRWTSYEKQKQDELSIEVMIGNSPLNAYILDYLTEAEIAHIKMKELLLDG